MNSGHAGLAERPNASITGRDVSQTMASLTPPVRSSTDDAVSDETRTSIRQSCSTRVTVALLKNILIIRFLSFEMCNVVYPTAKLLPPTGAEASCGFLETETEMGATGAGIHARPATAACEVRVLNRPSVGLRTD